MTAGRLDHGQHHRSLQGQRNSRRGTNRATNMRPLVGRVFLIARQIKNIRAVNRDVAAIEHFASLAAMGIDQAIFSMPNVYDLEPFDLLATEIIPVVEKIQVAGR